MQKSIKHWEVGCRDSHCLETVYLRQQVVNNCVVYHLFCKYACIIISLLLFLFSFFVLVNRFYLNHKFYFVFFPILFLRFTGNGRSGVNGCHAKLPAGLKHRVRREHQWSSCPAAWLEVFRAALLKWISSFIYYFTFCLTTITKLFLEHQMANCAGVQKLCWVLEQLQKPSSHSESHSCPLHSPLIL